MVNINWQFQAAVQGGPAIAVNTPALSVAAYDVVQEAIDAGQSGTLPVPPVGDPKDVLLLVLISDHYDSDPTKLSFDIGTSTTDNRFDGPLLLVGSGAVGLLSSGGSLPSSLKVNNNLAGPINVQLMVGRNLP